MKKPTDFQVIELPCATAGCAFHVRFQQIRIPGMPGGGVIPAMSPDNSEIRTAYLACTNPTDPHTNKYTIKSAKK